MKNELATREQLMEIAEIAHELLLGPGDGLYARTVEEHERKYREKLREVFIEIGWGTLRFS
jgi:hypothetical protein